jgi:hypothetical protein
METKLVVCAIPWKSLQHLFFDCVYAKFLWRSIHILFGIVPPLNIDDLFVNWSKRGNKKYNTLLLMAAAALFWAIWITKNEIVFDKCKPKSFFQVLFQGTHWLCQWANLQRHDLKDQMIYAAQHLETSALDFFGSNSWLSHRFVGFA